MFEIFGDKLLGEHLKNDPRYQTEGEKSSSQKKIMPQKTLATNKQHPDFIYYINSNKYGPLIFVGFCRGGCDSGPHPAF